jgi:hypothetical protein
LRNRQWRSLPAEVHATRREARRPGENGRVKHVPETQYARSGDVNIAYQVVGDGPFDLVFVPGYVTHLELAWKLPTFGPSLAEMASFSRLISSTSAAPGCPTRSAGRRRSRHGWTTSGR